MTLVASSPGAGSISRAPRPSSLADVLDLILDKGLVIDAYVRLSVAGIEVLTIDARVVIASVDTYLRFAEAVNRLDLSDTEQPGIQALTGGGSSGQKDKDDSSQSSSRDNGSAPRGERSGSSRSKAKVERDGSSGGRDNRSSDDGDEEAGGPGLIGRLAERGKFDK